MEASNMPPIFCKQAPHLLQTGPSPDFLFRPPNCTSNRKVCPGLHWAAHRFKSKQGLGRQLKSSADGKRIQDISVHSKEGHTF
ncbi:hypothetical protein CDAR_382021 [Caerostris darwini]|uniref:Uncharacterized protein n=1 Tax=Caerostris darwini TaxID=1538125 RepID=A0AAV4V6K1_9ARAC|nr:hypothetical protein CDAR_382021 [Caerostris darwini]